MTNEAGLAQIQYFANGTLVGTGTNAPYEVEWTPAPQGRYVLLAKAVDPDGGAAWSQPVNVTVGQDITVWGPRLLPTGELLSYYNAVVVLAGGLYMGSSDDVTSTNDALLTTVDVPGVFVDERVRGGMVRSRFYKVMSGQRLPP